MTWLKDGDSYISKGVLNQYLATIVVNMVSFGYGLGLGWSSPNVPILLSNESPLSTGPVSLNESEWISSLICIGGALGSVAYSLIIDRIGRKWSLMCIGIPQAVGFALIAFVLRIEALLVGRLLIGISTGGLFVVIPVFVAEIANDRIRGALGNVMALNICIGTLIAFILSHFFSYTILPFFGCIISSAFILIMFWLPDTPRSLKLRNQTTNAEQRSIKFYKRVEPSDQPMQWNNNEINTSQISDENYKITIADLMVPTTRKGILMGFAITALTQFCGSFAIINYTATIFKDAGSTLHPNVCAMVIALIQVLAVFTMVSLIDIMGRRALLMGSSSITAAFHIILGVYFYYQSNGYDVSAWSLLPLVCLSGIMFFVLGISMAPFSVAVELLPPKLRSSVPSVFLFMVWLLAFMFVKYFNTLVDVLEMSGSVWFFASFCIFNFILVAVWLPETKGKDYEEIRKAML